MLESILANPWPAAGAVALACLTAYFVYRNNRLNRFSAASSEFRGAFAATLAALKNPTRPIKNVPQFLTSSFSDHSKAVENFRHYLPRWRRHLFDRSWRAYHSGHSFDADKFGIEKKDQLFLQYYALEDDAQATALAIKNIENIISFGSKN